MLVFNYNRIKLLIVYIGVKLVGIKLLSYNYRVGVREFIEFNFV